MRIAVQTISWGEHIEDLPRLVAEIGKMGFQGVEFAQKVRDLGEPRQLRELLRTADVSAVGLSGGALPDCVEYARHLQPEYVYCDELDERGIERAIEVGVRVGLHPHLYKDVDSIAAASTHLRKWPQLHLIIDTAHLHLAGEDFVAVMTEYGDRVVAVHLKDWSSRFGVAHYRFARGFCALGRGELGQQLRGAIKHLSAVQFRGWLVIEQDVADGDPAACAAESLRWLRKELL